MESAARWRFVPFGSPILGMVPVPRPGWLSCGFCGSEGVVVRGWQFHVRPGKPSIPYRCDVHVKCAQCAAGWWHGVALSFADYSLRPAASGIRSFLLAGSAREPMLWASDRGGR